jgi:hypothetical protein
MGDGREWGAGSCPACAAAVEVDAATFLLDHLQAPHDERCPHELEHCGPERAAQEKHGRVSYHTPHPGMETRATRQGKRCSGISLGPRTDTNAPPD